MGFSGLTDVRQESLFPELAFPEATAVGSPEPAPEPVAPPTAASWRVGDDVTHVELGHGWVQGSGHGVVTVRFETRSSGPGPVRTFAVDEPGIAGADPVASLDWPDYPVVPDEPG